MNKNPVKDSGSSKLGRYGMRSIAEGNSDASALTDSKIILINLIKERGKVHAISELMCICYLAQELELIDHIYKFEFADYAPFWPYSPKLEDDLTELERLSYVVNTGGPETIFLSDHAKKININIDVTKKVKDRQTLKRVAKVNGSEIHGMSKVLCLKKCLQLDGHMLLTAAEEKLLVKKETSRKWLHSLSKYRPNNSV